MGKGNPGVHRAEAGPDQDAPTHSSLLLDHVEWQKIIHLQSCRVELLEELLVKSWPVCRRQLLTQLAECGLSADRGGTLPD